MVMARATGEELRREPFFLVNECFLVFVVHQGNGYFLKQAVVSTAIEDNNKHVVSIPCSRRDPSHQ